MPTTRSMIREQLHEILQEDVEELIRRELGDGPNRWTGRRVIKEQLAAHVGIQYRQFMRYLTGDAPFPADRLIPFCEAVGSTRVLGFLAHELGANLIPLPAIGPIDDYDIVDELAKSIQKTSGLIEEMASLFQRRPSSKGLKVIHQKARAAVMQILRCQAIYRDAVENGMLRRRRARKDLAAGQGTLFGVEP